MKKLLLLVIYLLLFISVANAQIRKATGTVISEDDGQPIIGATILVKGTQQGTVTDTEGRFSLNDIPEKNQILQISYVGMKTQEIPVKATLKIIMKPETEELEEVVVIGYGVTRKAAFTGAATSVGTSKITSKNDANPIKALEGVIPGLQMSITSGQPGAPTSIFIRGINSINSGTQPLYVVDGIPYFAESMGDASSGQTVSPLALLNPNDIESITVLKDATATSIYGARAANGVITITTKKGQTGKPQVNFTAKIGIETLPSIPRSYKKVNASEYLELTQEALLNGYATDGIYSLFGYYNDKYNLQLDYSPEGALQFFDWYTDGWYSEYKKYGYDTDWQGEVTRNGLIQNYNLDISGGGSEENSMKYFLSMGYMDEKGIVISKDLKRYSFRFNMEHQPVKYLKYGFNAALSHTNINLGSGGGFFSDPITLAYMMNPLTPVYTPNGEWNYNTSYDGYNPVAIRSKHGDQDNSKTYRVTLSPFVQINFSKQLFWLTRVGMDYIITDMFSYKSFLNPEGKETQGQGIKDQDTNMHLNITNTLNYIHTIGKDHHVNLMLGQEGQKNINNKTYLSASNYPVENLRELYNAAIPNSASTLKEELVLASFFANAQYDYADKYYASASWRYDGSSRFGKNNRWATFWSAGLKYRISSERFMEPTRNWLSNLTLRTSYGTSGNQEVGNSWYASRDLFGYGDNYNNQPGMAHDRFGNDNLKWEQTNKFNFGMDISLFDRIQIELDYYNHMTNDMVFAVPISMTTGLNSYYKNIGKLSNIGFEWNINAQLIRTTNWRWEVSVNGSHNKNRIKRLDTDIPIEDSYSILEKGYPLGQFKMKQYAGVKPETGEALWYKGIEGYETTTNYNEAGKRYLGSPHPDLSGAISTSLHWKNLDFSMQLNYSIGGKIFGDNLTYDEHIGNSLLENYTYYVYDNRWQKPGDITDVPRLTSEANYENNISSRFLMDGDYLKIRSLTLAYTIPKKWLVRTGIKQCRFFANAENIHTFCANSFRGFDPGSKNEDGSQWWNYPSPRNFTFGITMGF